MNIKNKNKGDIDCQYVGAVSVGDGACTCDNRQRRRRCRSNHSRTAVWRENDNDVVISTAKKPALPVIACSRLVLLITIRHASPRITPSNIIVLTTTSTESRSELFIRTCMSRYLKLHILSASHKFAYRRESS